MNFYWRVIGMAEDNNNVVDTFAFLESPVSKVIHSKGTEKFGKEEIPLDGRF
jgi:hypothetical protein